MMPKVFTTAAVIIPPKELWDPIQEIRKIYDRQIKRWMPHITLLYPFRPEVEFEDLKTRFSEVCRLFKNFEIKLEKLNYFSHKKSNYTIWLSPEPKYKIIELQSKLLEIVPDCNDVNLNKSAFTPHLSVGQFKGYKKHFLETIYLLQHEWNPLSFTLDCINFISRENSKFSRFQIQTQIYFERSSM